MKALIETKDIQMIADEIHHNALMLELYDEETASNDIDFYVPQIKQAAEELLRIVQASEQ